MKILVVERSEGLRKVLQALLSSAGHEVVGMLAGGDGIEEAVATLRPDLVCLDHPLPGDSPILPATIKAVAPAVAVLLMSAGDAADIAPETTAAGAAGCIRKPFSQEQLVKALDDIAEAGRRPQLPPESGGGAVAAADERPAGRRTAVIADDSASVRLVLKGLLDECGLRVVQSVGNGAEAVAAARKHRPAVLCLDVNMPVMAGLAALPLVREASPETAVVMVTGCADREFVTRAAALGARGYILKPLRPAYVLGFMRQLLP